jgi:hypothetical protein
MHCPKCGGALVDAGDGLACEPGEMTLAPRMAGELRGRFVTKTLPSPPAPRGRMLRVGGDWFCPGCGKRMLEQRSHIACADCGASLEGLVFALAQLAPHRDWPKPGGAA